VCMQLCGDCYLGRPHSGRPECREGNFFRKAPGSAQGTIQASSRPGCQSLLRKRAGARKVRVIRADQAANPFFGRERELGRSESFEPTRLPIPSSEECGSSEGLITRKSQSTLIDRLVDPNGITDWRRQLRLLPPKRNPRGND
jgi:hypothetical protein